MYPKTFRANIGVHVSGVYVSAFDSDCVHDLRKYRRGDPCYLSWEKIGSMCPLLIAEAPITYISAFKRCL